MSRIVPLPADAISQIHSSKHITSLQGVILALLENSLDAGASKVEIAIDFRRGGCTVEDNGTGIHPREFHEDGGLGKLYHTSKHGPLSNGAEPHGCTGTYLASLGALSLLSITSQHQDHNACARLTLHRGNVIDRHISAFPGEEISFSTAYSTRVVIRDLFGNMPVRVKLRAFADDAGAMEEKAWQEVKRGAVALVLAWPKPCAIKLRDENAAGRTLNITGFHPMICAALTEKHLNQLGDKPVKFGLNDALPAIFQSGLAPTESRRNWVPVAASASNISVKGLICLTPAPTRQCQFISIGVHPCSPASGHNGLYEAVNRTFGHSSFGTIDHVSELDEAEKDRRKRDRRYKSEGYTQKQLQGRKGVDRWPRFVLKLQFEQSQHKHALECSTSDHILKALADLLEVTVLQWLTAHHFSPRKYRTIGEDDMQQGRVRTSHSPARLSSTQCGRSGSPAANCMAKQNLKRAVTPTSATASKRRKIRDVSGREVNVENSAQRTQSSYFNGLSRIKSGKHRLYDELWEGQKRATSPARLPQTAVSLEAQRPQTAFNVPIIAASEPHSKRAAAILSKTAGAQGATRPVTAGPLLSQGQEDPSSDDFGSIDSTDLLQTSEAVEARLRLEEPISSLSEDESDEAVIDWTEPITKQIYKVNARTGVVLHSYAKIASTGHTANRENADVRRRGSAAIDTHLSADGRPLSLSRRHTVPIERHQNRWFPSFLKAWDNPVFKKPDEERIPVASFDGPELELNETGKHHCPARSPSHHFAEIGIRETSKLSKSQVKKARVIRQIDDKFILCSMPSGDGDILVLIDQHAASERVILEQLLSELCRPVDPSSHNTVLRSNTGHQSAIETNALDPPQRFQIPASEHQLFRRHVAHFARWGILYDLSSASVDITGSQVRRPDDAYLIAVRALPFGIAERCTTLPSLLIDLLRSEVWKLAGSEARSATTDQPNSDHDKQERHDWLRRIGFCPQGIIDMLNSRACRSAIMFNDALTVQECEELVADLAECAFPFMCAHGRVSMVPLLLLKGDNGQHVTADLGPSWAPSTVSGDENRASFAAAFSRWQKHNTSPNEEHNH